jgi:hypothetical protein
MNALTPTRASVALLTLGLALPATAQTDSTAPAPAPYRSTPLFIDNAVLDITLTMDVRTVVRDIDSTEWQEHDAVLTYVDATGAGVDVNVEVRTRGHFRRQRRNCNFPPLRLDVKTGSAEGTVFDGQDKLKLVTHCQNGRDEYDQYVVLEYLVYRTFNVVTDLSYRARLARMTYVDTEAREDTLKKTGIIIESDEELVARLNGRMIEIAGVHPTEIDHDYMGLVDIFQYMMGNTDWSVSGLHNVNIVQSELRYLAVPYDFDWTGIVDARYARPDARLGIRNVRDRLFRGFCRDPASYAPVFQLFHEKKDEIYSLYQTPLLDDDHRKDAIEYLDEFYQVIGDERRIKREITDRCREVSYR